MTVVNLPNGGVALVRLAKPKCTVCRKRQATLQCDFPISKGASKTCDRNLCRQCAVHIGPNRDYCPHHTRRAAA